jgi:2-polyprenyl-3-methyl-5-hydroxy-6-metoxy-1,4-benzoquinol methylase
MIADNYGRIFPLSIDKINPATSFLKESDRFLDIGCATGKLCITLAKQGYEAYGIDLNSRMIEIAHGHRQKNNHFRVMNMLHIYEEFADITFSLITSFGNTIPLTKLGN